MQPISVAHKTDLLCHSLSAKFQSILFTFVELEPNKLQILT